MSGPGVDVLEGREDFLALLGFAFQEALEVEKVWACDLIGEVGQPGVVESVDLELEQVLLLGGELGEPGVFVERFRRGRGGRGVRGGLGIDGLGRAKEGCNGGVLGLLGVGGGLAGGLALDGGGHCERAMGVEGGD